MGDAFCFQLSRGRKPEVAAVQSSEARRLCSMGWEIVSTVLDNGGFW
jgi:hypothetical protein